MLDTDRRWMRISELAKLWERSPRTLRDWIAKGKLPATKRGAFWYVEVAKLRYVSELSGDYGILDFMP